MLVCTLHYWMPGALNMDKWRYTWQTLERKPYCYKSGSDCAWSGPRSQELLMLVSFLHSNRTPTLHVRTGLSGHMHDRTGLSGHMTEQDTQQATLVHRLTIQLDYEQSVHRVRSKIKWEGKHGCAKSGGEAWPFFASCFILHLTQRTK